MEEIEMLIGLLKQKIHERKPSNLQSLNNHINNNKPLPELASKYNVFIIF